jgi:phage anti-repressor protein
MLNLFRSPKKQEIVQSTPNVDLSDPLVRKLQQCLSSEEQQLFIHSFYGYLNYHFENDFVIDLDNIWEWLGYAQKVKAKELLEKHFTKDVDYKVNISRSGKNRVGRNTNQYVMNVKTFKKLCIKADTKTADKIHDYYIKMEEILQEHTKEQLQIQTDQLQLKEQEYQHQLQAKEQELLKYKEKTYEEIEKIGHLYVIKTDGGVKVGKTKDAVTKRLKGLQTGNVNNIQVLLDYPTSNADILEKVVHYILDRYRCNSNREFFDCDVEHIKRVVCAAGSMIDTLKSCYQHISVNEFEKQISSKIGAKIENCECETNIEENCECETNIEIWNWFDTNIEYKKNNILQLKELCDTIGTHLDIKMTNKQKCKIKLEVQKWIKENYPNANHDHQDTYFNNIKYRGWIHFCCKNK